jgi:hypothetical protein
VIDIDLEVPIKPELKQIDSYDKALAGGRISFSDLFQWFRNREDIESELRLENNPDYRDKQLEAVRQNRHSIESIKNPSEVVQLEAVKQDGKSILYIKNPSEAQQQTRFEIEFRNCTCKNHRFHNFRL